MFQGDFTFAGLNHQTDSNGNFFSSTVVQSPCKKKIIIRKVNNYFVFSFFVFKLFSATSARVFK